jgi:hypothetical protein
MIKYHILKTAQDVLAHIQKHQSFKDTVVKGVNLADTNIPWSTIDVTGAAFMGCRFQSVDEESVRHGGARVFRPFEDLPYDPFRSTVYSPKELMHGYDPNIEKNRALDYVIQRHFEEHGGHDPDIMEAMAQMLHDYSIDQAIKELLDVDADTGLPRKKAVGIMGGHLCLRNDPYYRKTAHLAAELTREGYFVTCGGGPGIMEAANLGAYLADFGAITIDEAISILSVVPDYETEDGKIAPGYITQAQEVIRRYPNGRESLAIPTWFYGHEPVNMFASHIAKYFSNSLREDGLLAISVYGIVYAPGSAATAQEVFADGAQNHYGTFDFISPMVFLGTEHYHQSQIYSCLVQQAAGHPYAQMITIYDEPEKVIKFIKAHPPLRASS